MCSIKHFVFPGYPGAAQINLSRTVQTHNCPALLLAHSDWQYFNPNPRRCHLLVHAPTPLQCVPKQEMRINSRKRRGKHSINFEYLGQMSAYSGFGSTPPTALRWQSSCVKADQTVSTCCPCVTGHLLLDGVCDLLKMRLRLGKGFCHVWGYCSISQQVDLRSPRWIIGPNQQSRNSFSVQFRGLHLAAWWSVHTASSLFDLKRGKYVFTWAENISSLLKQPASWRLAKAYEQRFSDRLSIHLTPTVIKNEAVAYCHSLWLAGRFGLTLSLDKGSELREKWCKDKMYIASSSEKWDQCRGTVNLHSVFIYLMVMWSQ